MSSGAAAMLMGKGSPRIVRVIILAQTCVITLLSLVMVREYLVNPFLQEYVNRVVETEMTAETVFGLILLGVLGSGLFTIMVAWRYGQSLPVAGYASRSVRVRAITRAGLTLGSQVTSPKITEASVEATVATPVPRQAEQRQGPEDKPSP